jgi:two-component system sensor kinase FixL
LGVSIDKSSAHTGDAQLRFRSAGFPRFAFPAAKRRPNAPAAPAIPGAPGMMTEGTVRQRMAESSLLRAVTETVIDGLITIDAAGIINSFNPAAVKILGYRPDEVIGKNVKMLMPEPYLSEHDGYLANYRRTGEAKAIGKGREVIARRKDGTTLPIELGVGEMRIGGKRMFVGIIRDITDRKEREASEAHLRNLLNTIVDGLITIDEVGNVLSANPAAERLFGYAEAEMLGRNVKMLMPEPYRSEHDGYISSYRDTGRAKIIGVGGRDVVARRKDGTTFPMELGVSEMKMRGKRVFAGIIRDITARKKAEEEAGLLAAVIKSSEDAIVSKSLDGTIISWNSAAERLFGYSSVEALGQSISMLVPRERLPEEERFTEQIARAESIQHFETVRRTKDGRLVDISLTLSPILNAMGQIVGASKIARDITARKASEAQLKRYMQAVERSNQELDDFAYIASHDLKEPLRGLANNAMFLEEDSGAKIDEAGVKRLHRMTFLCHRMERLVDDLLYFSRLGRQELAIQPADLNAMIGDIRATIDAALHGENVTIDVPEPLPVVVCDVPRVTEVFRNLISNGIKYNKSGQKRIEIGATHRAKEGGPSEDVFYVRDNGMGIGPEFHNDIFRIFKRLNDEDDAVKGTGVGLTFVKKIVERHQGRIWVDSSRGNGSTFYFTLNTYSEASNDE